MPQYPCLLPDLPNTSQINKYLQEIDKNAWYTNFGPLNTLFEKLILKNNFIVSHIKDQKTHLCTCSNGTLAIQLLLKSLNLPKNARILIPAFTFPATALAVIQNGYTPVMTSVDKHSWILTPDIARQCITKTSLDAIIPVTAFGQPVNSAEWAQLSKEAGIPIVVDAAGAFDVQTIAPGVHAAFSLHATKPFGIGEGGLCASTDENIIGNIRQLSNFGLNKGIVEQLGTNAKLSEYHSAVGLAQIDRWQKVKYKRKKLASYMTQKLTELPITLQAKDGQQIPSIFPLLLPINMSPEKTLDAMQMKSIELRRWYCPTLEQHPIFKKYDFIHIISDSTISNKVLSERLICIPFHSHLTTSDIDYIVATLSELIQ